MKSNATLSHIGLEDQFPMGNQHVCVGYVYTQIINSLIYLFIYIHTYLVHVYIMYVYIYIYIFIIHRHTNILRMNPWNLIRQSGFGGTFLTAVERGFGSHLPPLQCLPLIKMNSEGKPTRQRLRGLGDIGRLGKR